MSPKKKARLLGGTVATIAGGALAATLTLGSVAAQTPTPSPNATPKAEQRRAAVQSFLDQLAAKLGVSVDRLETAIKDVQRDAVRARLAEGKITQEQADRMLQAIESGRPGFFGPLMGPRGAHGPGRPGPRILAPLAGRSGAVAALEQLTGASREEIARELREGKSLAQIAAARGKSEAELRSATLAKAKESLDQAVANGRLTREAADRMYEQFSQNVDRILTATPRVPGRP